MFAVLSIFGAGFVLSMLGVITNALGLTHFGAASLAWVLPLALISLIISLGLFILTGRGLRRLTRALDAMLAASDRVAAGDYAARMEEQGPPEIRLLARGFNSMAGRLQSTDQQRRNMLADISHELRTPLTVIQGNVEGMLDGLYPADGRMLRSILEETQLLSRLVDDLRTLSLAEAGVLQLRREPFDMAALIRDTVEGFRSRAETAEIRLEAQLEPVPAMELDPARMREVLSNLISNALHFSPAGGTVHIGFKDSTVSVKDDGPGIPVEDIPHVFERFFRSRDSGGMGLGLSIAKYLVEAHGGQILLESQPGQGTRISFTLPR
jgi:signal transduction histidine kinase